MTELVADPSQYYIVTATDRRDERTRVLKHGDTFAVFDAFGDIAGVGQQVEVYEPFDIVALGELLENEVCADEAGTAGNEQSHNIRPSSSSITTTQVPLR